jgi:hypothetical protein
MKLVSVGSLLVASKLEEVYNIPSSEVKKKNTNWIEFSSLRKMLKIRDSRYRE